MFSKNSHTSFSELVAMNVRNDYDLYEWTGAVRAACQDVCSPNPCLNSGQCYLRPASEVTASSPLPYTCTCSGGFWGVNCSNFNPCSSLGACNNGGTCHNTSSVTYSCECPDGFYGDRCEVRDKFNSVSYIISLPSTVLCLTLGHGLVYALIAH